MSLIAKDIVNKIPNLYETENQEEKICYVKLFSKFKLDLVS